MNIVELTGRDLEFVFAVVELAVKSGERLRLSTDERVLQLARAGMIWTIPFGNPQ